MGSYTLSQATSQWKKGNCTLQNRNDTVSIKCSKKSFFLWDKNHNNVSNKFIKYYRNFKKNDKFKMIFDFKENEFTIYCNKHKAGTLPLNTKQVIPALTLFHPGNQFKITNWRF